MPDDFRIWSRTNTKVIYLHYWAHRFGPASVANGGHWRLVDGDSRQFAVPYLWSPGDWTSEPRASWCTSIYRWQHVIMDRRWVSEQPYCHFSCLITIFRDISLIITTCNPAKGRLLTHFNNLFLFMRGFDTFTLLS